jgi:Family of unknown function (DUF6404)
MNTNTKRTRALKVLAATGIWRSNYEPPLLRLLWRLGLNVPPPHFAGFFSTAAIEGVFFGVLWGFLMWLLVWSSRGMTFTPVAVLSALTDLFFGLAMAGYYAQGKHKYKLPTWQELGVQSGDA